jgi:hypothetical protein
MARLVFRGGSHTDTNLTPRLGPDTSEERGKAPGLSTFTTLERAVKVGSKAQVIDLDLLPPPLKGIPDDPLVGGSEGHVSIAPVSPEGAVDRDLLSEWAATRETGQTHWLTVLLKDALVQTNKKRVR